MKKAGPGTRKWIKGFHLTFAGVWTGAAICLVLTNFVKIPVENGDELYGILASARLIDDYIIIPAAMGSLLTGLLISLFTNWGFFRHWWVIVKWGATVAMVLFGTFFLGPWLNGMEEMTEKMRAAALAEPVFFHNLAMNRWFGTVQVALLVVLIFISVFRPWGKRGVK